MEQEPLENSAKSYAIGEGDDSIADYAYAFAFETLPDVSFNAIRVTADQQNGKGRFVTCVTENQYTSSAHELIIQIEPSARILGFRLLDDESRTILRSSRKQTDGGGASSPTPQPTVVPTPSAASFDALKRFVETDLMPQIANRSTEEITEDNTAPWLNAAEKAKLYFTGEWRAELLNQKYSSDFVFRLALSQLGPQAMWTPEQNQWVEGAMARAMGESGAEMVHGVPRAGELGNR